MGDALSFVGRIREIIDTIHLFEDFDQAELECFAGYMHCFRAPLGTEIIAKGQPGDFMMLMLDGGVE